MSPEDTKLYALNTMEWLGHILKRVVDDDHKVQCKSDPDFVFDSKNRHNYGISVGKLHTKYRCMKRCLFS